MQTTMTQVEAAQSTATIGSATPVFSPAGWSGGACVLSMWDRAAGLTISKLS